MSTGSQRGARRNTKEYSEEDYCQSVLGGLVILNVLDSVGSDLLKHSHYLVALVQDRGFHECVVLINGNGDFPLVVGDDANDDGD